MNQNSFILSNLNFDLHNSLKDNDSLVYYVRNGDVSDYTNTENTSFVQNANSNELCVKFPENYEYKGHIKLDLDDFILFLKNETTSGIFLFNETRCTLLKVIEAPCLDFTNRVFGRYKYHNGHRVIYFVDGKSIRYLNLGEIPYEYSSNCDDCNNTVLPILDCDKLKVFKDFTPPNITIDITDGNIPDGVYQIAISRTEGNDNDDWFIYSDRVNLHCLQGINRRFGLIVNLGCINWEGEFKLALIAHREDRGIVAQEIGLFTTKTKSISISELDSTYYFPISNEQLYETKAVYQSAEFISTNSEHLLFGKLTERPDINYQIQANKIKSEVGIFKVNAKDAYKHPSFQSNEVYSFKIQGVYRDGQTTNWFHIPNNHVPDDSWFLTVSNNDTWDDPCEVDSKKKWEVYNSAELITLDEENDNGASGISIIADPYCKEYKIQTDSAWWQGTLTYRDCDNVLIVLEDIYPNVTFCTKDISSATWVFKPFNKTVDLVQVSEKGYCDTNIVTDYCTKYKVSDRFKAYTGTNCGTITYDKCTSILGTPNTETCGVSTIFSGNISDYTFCSCYFNFDIFEFNIDIQPCAYSFEFVKQCGTSDLDAERDGNCDFKLVGRSTFAYWESDIKYSNYSDDLFGNLPKYESCKTGIRHHKFPDRTQILGTKKFPHIHSNTSKNSSKEFVYILAPRFYDIPPFLECDGSIVKDIIGYRIGYDSRDNNKSVIHSGIIYNMREETLPDCNKSYYPNYPFNDLNADDLIGTYEYVKAGNIDPTRERGRFVAQSIYSKDKFQYISPNIQYEKNDRQATELITLREENGYVSGEFSQTDEVPRVVIMSDAMYNILANLIAISFAIDFIPGVDAPFSASDIAITLPDTLHKLLSGKNYAYNIVETSNYTRSNTTNIIQGNRRRKIDDSFYMQPIRQQKFGTKINNFERESGLFLDLNKDLIDPSIHEKSRTSYRNIGNLIFSDDSQTDLKTSSYYVQLKQENKTQYGGLNDGIVRPISDLINLDSGYLIKGDIYITKHKYIRKFPFFKKLPLNAPFDTPYVISDGANVGYPHYWLDVVDRNELLNVLTKNAVGRLVQSIANYSGNNYYLEPVANPSKRNCAQGEKREYSFGLINGIYYTHYIGISEYYCESEYIGDYREINEIPQSNYNRDIHSVKEYNNILYPEMFLYNQQQRFKGVFSKYKNFDLSKDCCDKQNYAKDRIIFSLKNDSLSKTDKWTKFLSRNYHQFSQQDGEFRGVFEVNNYNLLFFFDNATYVTQTDDSILTQNGTLYLGTGSIFERRMKKISSEINGLGGNIDYDSFVNTPFGSFWADRNRKTFIGFEGQSILDLSGVLKSFFIHWNDKPIKGIYDSFSRNIYWSNGDWTVAYKPEAKKWISWYDWIPDYLINTNFNFLSVKNNSLWKHNKENHYQTYYDKVVPFEVGFTINNKFKQEQLQNIEVFSEFYKNLDWGQRQYVDQFFNKVFLYSERSSTGLKNLEMKRVQNPFQHYKGENIEVSHIDEFYRINGFKNFLETTPTIKWDNDKYKPLNVLDNPRDDKNPRLYSKWFNLHLISDNLPEVKKLVQINVTQSKDIVK